MVLSDVLTKILVFKEKIVWYFADYKAKFNDLGYDLFQGRESFFAFELILKTRFFISKNVNLQNPKTAFLLFPSVPILPCIVAKKTDNRHQEVVRERFGRSL